MVGSSQKGFDLCFDSGSCILCYDENEMERLVYDIFLLNGSYETDTSFKPFSPFMLMEEPNHLNKKINKTSFREGLSFSTAVCELSNLDLW